MKSSYLKIFANLIVNIYLLCVLHGLVLITVFLCAPPIFAEQLPIKNYTVADGLAHNRIMRIFQDAKGYLWVATGEGLSRFQFQ